MGINGLKWERKRMTEFKRNIRRTYKNKFCAIALVVAGMLPMIFDNDGTALLLMLMIAIPLFFSKKKWVY